jgi:AbrB family looped-hinge helix DNA binding protein
MVKAPAKIINDGRVTIPADIRHQLDLEEGDYVMVDVERLNTESGGSDE